MAVLLPKEKLNKVIYEIQEAKNNYVVPKNIFSISNKKEQGTDEDMFTYYYYIIVNDTKILYGMLDARTEPMVFKQKEAELYKDMQTEIDNILNMIYGDVMYGVK